MQTSPDHTAVPLDVLSKVRAELEALRPTGSAPIDLTEISLLIDDVGLDSLKFVDLTVRLESTFGFSEFPMQDWVDGQVAANLPLTVGELARACQSLLGEGVAWSRS